MIYFIQYAFMNLVILFSSTGYMPKGANCLDVIISVTMTLNNRHQTAPKWQSNLKFINFLFSASLCLCAVFSAYVRNSVKQTESYIIGVTFCSSKAPRYHSDTLIVTAYCLCFDQKYDDDFGFCFIAATWVQKRLVAFVSTVIRTFHTNQKSINLFSLQ